MVSLATATLGAAGIGALGGLLGSRSSARMSREMAREQMAFQERMSNTAYQRAAKDLEAAGLNRILAFGNPAAVPGGAMGQVPDFGSTMSQAAQAGAGAMFSAAQVNKTDAEIDKLVAQTSVETQRALQEIEKTQIWQVIAPQVAEAGKDFGKLVELLKGGKTEQGTNLLETWIYHIRDSTDRNARKLDQVLRGIYGSRYTESTIPIIIQEGMSK